MNERIKALALQAGVTGYFAAGTEYATPIPLSDEVQKFAELIVQDCTRIIANQAWESRTAGANGDWTEFNSLSRVAGQIKQHFGVEE
jgi:hypothetical protein